jgi:ribosomal protein L7/L12
MTDPLQTGLSELFHAAGGCALEGDLRGVQICMNAIQPLLAEVDARLNPVEHEVVLESFGDRKINIIKELRSMCKGLGLKDAKDLAERAPVVVMSVCSEGDAEVYAQKLRNAGGSATVRAKGANV